MRLLLSACIALSLLCLVTTPAKAAQCPTRSALNTKVWRDFDAFVKQEYTMSIGYPRTFPLAYGHALGRLAIAVDDKPDRADQFACVQLALEQMLAGAKLQALRMGANPALLASVDFYEITAEASRAFHDAEVARVTGVKSGTPLYSVFGVKASAKPKPQPVPKPQPIAPRKPTAPPPPAPVQLVASAGSQCTIGENWSLANAANLFRAAETKRIAFVNDFGRDGTCTADGWFACRDIARNLWKARDEIFQVFDQNHDGINDCRKCSYRDAIAAAKPLVQWEQWLSSRYYGSAQAMGNMSSTIAGHQNDPVCKTGRPTPNGTISLVPGLSLLAAGNTILPTGHYAMRTSGVGYIKKWDKVGNSPSGKKKQFDTGTQIVEYDDIDYADLRTGSDVRLFYLWPPRDDRPGKTFAELLKPIHKRFFSVGMEQCNHGPHICYEHEGKQVCKFQPEIWVDGPTVELVGGPYKTEKEAIATHACAGTFPGRRWIGSNPKKDVCVNWVPVRKPFPDVLKQCGINAQKPRPVY